MAVRKLSARNFRFVLGRAVTRSVPSLRASMPFYDRVIPMIDSGTSESFTETQNLVLDKEETAFARLLPEYPPPRIERNVALIALKDATLMGLTGAVIDEKRECLLSMRGARGFVTYHDFRPIPSKRVEKPPANYFNMLGSYRGHRHFFHFLFDRLPRLCYLLERFALGREHVVILTNDDLPAFQRDIYRFIAARHPNIRFEAVPTGERWCLPQLYHIDDFQPIKRTLASPEVVAFLRSLVFEGYDVGSIEPSRSLYVSRSDTRKRRIRNEGEITPILAEKKFETLAPGRLPFREQVSLFAQAKAVAGPHGAGLTNILFSPPEARILELFPSTKVKNTYFLLAKSVGQTYRAIVGSKGGRHEWFDVDPGQVRTALDNLVP